MPESDPISSGLYCGLPTLSCDNFNEWKIQVTVYLTGVADHVCVISRRPNALGVISDPRRPLDVAKAAKWDASERMALGVIMSTVAKLHNEIILLHCEANRPIYQLWTKIGRMHQSHDGSL